MKYSEQQLEAKADMVAHSIMLLTKEYFEPVKKELTNGKEINLSQPVVVAYHKLHSNRPYDLTDLQKLRPNLQEKDFAMLRQVLEGEIEETERKVVEKLQEAWSLISPLLEITHDQKVISEQLLTHPDIEKRRDDPKVSEYVWKYKSPGNLPACGRRSTIESPLTSTGIA